MHRVDKLNQIYNEFREKYDLSKIQSLYILLFLFIGLIFFICGWFNKSIFLDLFFPNKNDMFMDYFNSIWYSYDHPYTKYLVIYPPLITSFYNIIGQILIPFIGEESSTALRETQLGIMSYILITIFCIFLFFIIFNKILTKKTSPLTIYILAFTIIFSYPFVYAIERGNSIIYTLVFILLFLVYYNSEIKYKRIFAYICLGIAAGIKIYPLIFGLLLVRQRNSKEIITCLIIGLICIFVPFIFTDGSINSLISSISSYSASTSHSDTLINISNIISSIFAHHLSPTNITLISTLISGLLLIYTAIIVLFSSLSNWKLITIISINLMIGLGIPTVYLMAYLLIGFLFFLKEEKEANALNVTYLLYFTIIFAIFMFEPSNLVNTIKAFSAYVICILLIIEGWKSICQKLPQIS